MMLAVFSGSAAEPTAATNQLSGQITKVGLYTLAGPAIRVQERDSATGFVSVGGRVFHSAATNVPLVKGVSFGYDFRVQGLPKDRPIRLTHLITHPRLKKPDGTVVEKQSSIAEVRGQDGAVTGSVWYTLREDFEMVPGCWTITVLQDDAVLVRHSFLVAAPEASAKPPK